MTTHFLNTGKQHVQIHARRPVAVIENKLRGDQCVLFRNPNAPSLNKYKRVATSVLFWYKSLYQNSLANATAIVPRSPSSATLAFARTASQMALRLRNDFLLILHYLRTSRLGPNGPSVFRITQKSLPISVSSPRPSAFLGSQYEFITRLIESKTYTIELMYFSLKRRGQRPRLCLAFT